MNKITERAYAKINLGLDVIGTREDGYHLVKMIMQTVGIYDELTVEKAADGIRMTTDAGELPTDDDNLIVKAARLMQEKYHIAGGIRVHLAKSIPIAAGMAGGSSDAAAMMRAMNELYELNRSPEELAEIAVKIGADVPYCIFGGTMLSEGIGEILTELPVVPKMTLLIAKPNLNVATGGVYKKLDAISIPHHPDIDGMQLAIKEGNREGILERLGNVLELVTIPENPVIATIKERMLALGAKKSLMSGSGPTVFGIFEHEADAGKAYETIREEGLAKQIFVTETVGNPYKIGKDAKG